MGLALCLGKQSSNLQTQKNNTFDNIVGKKGENADNAFSPFSHSVLYTFVKTSHKKCILSLSYAIAVKCQFGHF